MQMKYYFCVTLYSKTSANGGYVWSFGTKMGVTLSLLKFNRLAIYPVKIHLPSSSI